MLTQEPNIYIYIYKRENSYIDFKIPSLMAKKLCYQADVNRLGFDPTMRHIACLSTLISFDTTKHYVDDKIIYIYIYTHILMNKIKKTYENIHFDGVHSF